MRTFCVVVEMLIGECLFLLCTCEQHETLPALSEETRQLRYLETRVQFFVKISDSVLARGAPLA